MSHRLGARNWPAQVPWDTIGGHAGMTGLGECPECRSLGVHFDELRAFGLSVCFDCGVEIRLDNPEPQREAPTTQELIAALEEELRRAVEETIERVRETDPLVADYLATAVQIRRNVGRLADYFEEQRAELLDAEQRTRDHSLGVCHSLSISDLASLVRKYWTDQQMLKQVHVALELRTARRARALAKEVKRRLSVLERARRGTVPPNRP